MSGLRIEKQLAVFLDNRPGALARTCQALSAASVNIAALAILDTMDYCVIRMVVDRPDIAERVLTKESLVVQVRDVLVMDLPNEAGSLGKVAQRLAEAGINIEYAYCTSMPSQDIGALVLRTNDLESTINVLS